MLPIKEVVHKLNDIPDITNDTLKLGSYYNIEKLEQFKVKTDKIVSSTKTFTDTILKSDNITKSDLKDIAVYVKAMAEYLTTIGIIYYLYAQLIEGVIILGRTVVKTK